MAKVYYYVVLAIGLTILMKMAGVPYGGEELLNWIGLNTDSIYVTTSYFFLAIISMFGIAAAMGQVLTNRESSLKATLAIGMTGTIVGCFVGILNYVKDISTGSQEWVFWVTFLVFSSFITGFIMSMISWWTGVDG